MEEVAEAEEVDTEEIGTFRIRPYFPETISLYKVKRSALELTYIRFLERTPSSSVRNTTSQWIY